MTRKELTAALAAWQLAIEERVTDTTNKDSFRAMAEGYGRRITAPAHLDATAGCFDFDAIDRLIGETTP